MFIRKTAVLALLMLGVTRGVAQSPIWSEEIGHPSLTDTQFSVEPSSLDTRSVSGAVMNATYPIICGEHNQVTATAIILRVGPRLPGTKQLGLLVTANHVFDGCAKTGDAAKIRFRYLDDNDILRLGDLPVRITKGHRPLWTKHVTGDIAALPITLPEIVIRKTPIPEASILADADTLKKQLLSGLELSALGYPFGTGLTSFPMTSFPILRTGRIQVDSTEGTFRIHLQNFPGDSGGPIFGIARDQTGARLLVFGLMIQAQVEREPMDRLDGKPQIFLNFVGITVAATSTQILETIRSMPPASDQ